MSVADVVQEVAYARFLREFDYATVWPQYCMDVSAEIQGGGDAISLPRLNGSPTAQTTTLSNAQGDTLSNHTWPDPGIGDPADTTLNINQVKRFNVLIPTVHQAQVVPSVLARQMELVAREMARDVNSYIRGVVRGINENTNGRLANVDVSAANFSGAQAAFLGNLRAKFEEAQITLDYNAVPEDGRVAILSPRLYSYLIHHFEEQKIPFDPIPINAEGTSMAVIRQLSGFRLVKDASAGDGVTNSDDSKHFVTFLRAGEGIAYARQVMDMAAIDGMRSGAAHDGWLVRGRLVYGAVIAETDKLTSFHLDIS